MNASVEPLGSTAAPATPSTSGRKKILALVGVLFALGFPAIPISRFFDEFANTRTLIGASQKRRRFDPSIPPRINSGNAHPMAQPNM